MLGGAGVLYSFQSVAAKLGSVHRQHSKCGPLVCAMIALFGMHALRLLCGCVGLISGLPIFTEYRGPFHPWRLPSTLRFPRCAIVVAEPGGTATTTAIGEDMAKIAVIATTTACRRSQPTWSREKEADPS